MRRWLSFSVALLVSAFALHASAFGAGNTGNSGKGASICSTTCHKGGTGTAPTVTIEGPASLAAGAEGEYTLKVGTTLAKASCNIAVDKGTLKAGTGLKLVEGELTHSASIAGAGAEFTFKVKAPASGKVKIFAVGLGSDGTGQENDVDGKTTKEISITGGAAKSSSSTSGDDGDDDGAKPSSNSGGDDDDEDDNATGIANSGCVVASGGGDTTIALAFAGVALALHVATRRRRTRT